MRPPLRYRLSKRALKDIDAIALYIVKDNASAAYRFIDAVFHRLEMLERAPRSGIRRDDLGSGIRTIGVGQYLILYKVGDTRLEVDRILHGKRDLPKLVKR